MYFSSPLLPPQKTFHVASAVEFVTLLADANISQELTTTGSFLLGASADWTWLWCQSRLTLTDTYAQIKSVEI